MRVAIECAKRSAERAALIVNNDLERGVGSLKAFVCIAPLMGGLATAAGLVNALRMLEVDTFGDIAGGVAETLVPAVLGFWVAVLASCAFHYLSRQLAALNFEAQIAIPELLNQLDRLTERSIPHRPGA